MKLKLDTIICEPKTGTPYTHPDIAGTVATILSAKGPIPDTLAAVAAYLKSTDGEEEELTAGIVCYEALCCPTDKCAAPSRKLGELAYRILNAEDNEITIDNKEAAIIQDLLPNRWNVIITHQVAELLDGNDLPTVKQK